MLTCLAMRPATDPNVNPSRNVALRYDVNETEQWLNERNGPRESRYDEICVHVEYEKLRDPSWHRNPCWLTSPASLSHFHPPLPHTNHTHNCHTAMSHPRQSRRRHGGTNTVMDTYLFIHNTRSEGNVPSFCSQDKWKSNWLAGIQDKSCTLSYMGYIQLGQIHQTLNYPNTRQLTCQQPTCTHTHQNRFVPCPSLVKWSEMKKFRLRGF